MILRPYDELNKIAVGSEVRYLDQLYLDEQDGKVVFIEEIAPRTAFAYIASLDPAENDKCDYGVYYKDIMVFDDISNEMPDGSYRDPVMGVYGKLVGRV